MTRIENESRQAFHELLDLLREVDERYLGPEYLIESSDDVADGLRAVVHMLEGGIGGHFEQHASHPEFRRIVSPSRKFTGDNADAVYFDAPIDPARSYVVRGNLAGAVYTLVHDRSGNARRAHGHPHGGSPERRGVPGRCRRQLRDLARRRTAQGGLAPARGRGLARDDSPLLRGVPLGRRGPDARDSAADRMPGRAPSARLSQRCQHRGGDPARRELRTLAHAGHAASGGARATAVRQPDSQPVSPARHTGRLRSRRFRRRLFPGTVSAGPGGRARDPRPLAGVPLRERQSLEPALADLRLLEPPRRRSTANRRSSTRTVGSTS